MTYEPAVRAATETLFANWNTHDPETFAATFPENAEFTDVQGNVVRGRRAIAKLHVKPFEMLFQNAELSLSELSLKQLTNDVISANAHWKMSGGVSPRGEPLPDGHGILLIILVKRGDVWQPEVARNTDYSSRLQGEKLDPPAP